MKTQFSQGDLRESVKLQSKVLRQENFGIQRKNMSRKRKNEIKDEDDS